MARIRTVKPEFWTSEQVMDCSTTARLAFIGMWNFCDDAGIHPASAKTLKAEVFPADDIMAGDVQVLVDELKANGLIIEYEVAGKPYWQVTGWYHQKIEKPNFKHPKPEFRQPIDDHSPTDRRPIDDHSTPERRGEEKEGNGVNPSLSGAHEAEMTSLPTRKGLVCGMLRKAGMADAAPHYLTDEVWGSILSKRTNEEIVEVAKAKMAAMPNQRIGLKYIAKALLDDPQPITANARASQPGVRRQTVSDERKAASMILTGRKPENERPNASNTERDITADCERIA